MTGQRPVIFPSAHVCACLRKGRPAASARQLCTKKSGDTMQPANCFRTGSVI